ncbi:CpsD/CapB family tyrosine-protein kinase [Marinovum sp.]|uniref:CpsD/CapB family tyrosine-protein kinase n=1 Tax=Marinovum sp. TaxID=2024839 RepID=UPI003A927A0D
MEKRWTRKKRALRDAGGPEPKPALTGPIRLAGEESAESGEAVQDRRNGERHETVSETAAPSDVETEVTTPDVSDDAAVVSPRRVARVVVAEPTPEPPEETEAPAVDPEPVSKEAEPEPEPKSKSKSKSKKSRKIRLKRRPSTGQPGPEAAEEPVVVAEAGPVPMLQPEVAPEPETVNAETPEPEAAQAPEPAPAPTPEPEPKAVSEPMPEPAPAPAEPEPALKAVPEPAPVPAPETAAEATPEPEPTPALDTAPHTDTEPANAPAQSNLAVLARKPEGSRAWDSLPTFPINARRLERNRIITATREDPVHSAFDVLRTKLLRALRENGWTRVAVTSPTEGCGKTFLAANLAISLSRQSNCRSILMDLDMRHPGLARALDIKQPPDLPAFLRGNLPMQDLLCRPAQNGFKISDQVAFGVNGQREPYAAELLQDPDTADVLKAMEAALEPDVILFDMPPALVNDDVLAARPLFDGIILVVGGGITKPQQVRDVERRLGTETPLLGIVLNRAEDEAAQIYGY